MRKSAEHTGKVKRVQIRAQEKELAGAGLQCLLGALIFGLIAAGNQTPWYVLALAGLPLWILSERQGARAQWAEAGGAVKRTAEEVAKEMGVKAPRVVKKGSWPRTKLPPSMGATMRIKEDTMVIGSLLPLVLTKRQLKALIAHEMAHKANKTKAVRALETVANFFWAAVPVWLLAALFLSSDPTMTLLAVGVVLAVWILVMPWLRRRSELNADQRACEVVRGEDLVQVLVALDSHERNIMRVASRAVEEGLSRTETLKEAGVAAREFSQAEVEKYIRKKGQRGASHPSDQDRIRRILGFESAAGQAGLPKPEQLAQLKAEGI